MDKITLDLVSANCLHGHPVPRALDLLWQAQLEGNSFLQQGIGLRLLTSLSNVKLNMDEADAAGDADILANIQAHRQVWLRLGIFAECEDGELLAFDLMSDDLADPAVVELDTEGTYSWKGITLAEAIFRIAEDREQGDAAIELLASRGLKVPQLGELGSTTQFLPSIESLHERLYYAALGDKRQTDLVSAHAADPTEPWTWLGRPGAEVRMAIAQLLGLPEGSGPSQFWVWCDDEGCVTNFTLPKVPEAPEIALSGIRRGMTAEEVHELLGTPSEIGHGSGWEAYHLGERRLHLALKNQRIAGISGSLIRS